MTDIDFFYNYNEDSSKHAEGRVNIFMKSGIWHNSKFCNQIEINFMYRSILIVVLIYLGYSILSNVQQYKNKSF